MITEYRPVSWTAGEPVSGAKLATMAANDQILFESMPKIVFNNRNVKKNRGVKIYAFTVLFPPKNYPISTTDVYFGDIFSVGCYPVVTVGVNSTTVEDRYHVNVMAIGGRAGSPDHRGFQLRVIPDNADRPVILNDLYVSIIAVGF